MPKPTYSLSAQGVAAASAGYVLGILEAGPAKTLKVQKLTIWNPGMETTAGLMTLNLVQQTTVGSGTTTIPTPMDVADPAFTGTVRVAGATTGTTGAIIKALQVWVPAAVAGFNPPLVLNFDDNPNEKPPTVWPGPVAPALVSTMTANSWYMVASLGNTIWNNYAQGGMASPAVGNIFQATGGGGGTTGTVTPLVLATALVAGTTYQIVSLGTTTTAQWQAAGAAQGYLNVGTTFKATGAAVGTGLCSVVGSGAGIALVAPNAAAGAASLSYTLEFTEE